MHYSFTQHTPSQQTSAAVYLHKENDDNDDYDDL